MNLERLRKTKIINVYRYLKDTSIKVSKKIISIVPKESSLFLFNAWFGEKYSDNTKYLYEFLLNSPKYKAVWTTKNKEVYKKLKEEHKPVVMSNSLKGMWTQIRAKVLFSTIQLNDYNPWLLSKCYYIDLNHGTLFKQVGYDIYSTSSSYNEKHDDIVKKDIDYYLSTPSYLTRLMIQHSFHENKESILLFGEARLDYFFDEGLRINTKVDKIREKKKTIVYMPTHRQCGKIPLHSNKILDLKYINNLCEKYGYIFIIKKHFYHRNEKDDLSLYNNIIDITDNDIDPQDLLYNADILITDYSSCYIDYLVLNRPIILYPFDVDEYLKTERGMFLSISDLDAGYIANNIDELNSCIQEAVEDDTDKYKFKRDAVKRIFFDESLETGHFREQILKTVEQLLDGTYKSPWNKIENHTSSDIYFEKLAEKIINK